MIGRGLPRAALGLLLCGLGACAEPVNDVRVWEGVGGSGSAPSGACQAPTCGACATCQEMCACSGSSPAKCQSLCASGTGGKAGSGGAGGSGAAGGYGATGGAGGYGATGGYTATGGYGGSGSTCSVSVGDPTCDACIASQCCTETEACAYSQSCGDLMSCLSQASQCQTATSLSELLSCADTACPAYSAGKAAFSGYLSCLSTRCSAECGAI